MYAASLCYDAGAASAMLPPASSCQQSADLPKGHGANQPLQQSHNILTQPAGGMYVGMNGVLQLSPPQVEAAAWQSPSATRLLRALDGICLTNSIFITVGLLKAFGGVMAGYQMFQVLLYGALAVVQFYMLLRQPKLYQPYRFQVTLVNRLLRLATTTLAAATSVTHAMRRFAAANSWQNVHPTEWWWFLRLLLGTPLFFLNHANFVLPFVYVLAAQLWTLAASLVMMRSSVCLAAELPSSLQRSQKVCTGLKLAMHYLGLQVGKPPMEAAADAAAECEGLQGLLLLSVYSNVLVLLIVPCLVVYFVELNMKMGFLQQQRLVLQHAGPCQGSLLAKAVLVHGVVVGGWIVCEVYVWALSPFHCSAHGILEAAATLWAG